MAHLVPVYMTSIAFHLTAAPKFLKHVETNNPAAITGKFCAGDAERQTHKSLYNKTQRNVLLCNSSYMVVSRIIKNMCISKNELEKISVFPS